MRKYKKMLYVGLGMLAVIVLLTIVLWAINRDNVYLILMGVFAGLFLIYFGLLIAVNAKTGWQDENTPYMRVRSNEKLLLHLYPLKGKTFVAALYEPYDVKLFAQWLKENWEGDTADMGPPDSVYLGWTKVKDYRLNELQSNTVLLSAETEQLLRGDSELAPFFKNNHVLSY